MNKLLHDSEKDQFRKLFKRKKIDKFDKRFQILKIFLKIEGHVSLSELLLISKKKGISAKNSFIKSTMDLMCEYGFAHKYKFKNKELRYEHMHLGQHHDHMICIKCSDVLEFKNKTIEKLQLLICKNHNFHILQHRMDLYGICSKCIKNKKKKFLLSDASEGEILIIKKIIAKKKTLMYLYSLGIKIGDTVELIMNSSKKHIVIALESKRIIISYSLSRKIIVSIK